MSSQNTLPPVDAKLLPDKYEDDLFICDVADAVLRDIMPHMEHPFYTLSKKPDTAIRRYEHKGNWVEITPSVKGIATIYDKDIIVYCVSQIMAKLNRGEVIDSPKIRITTHDLLKFTNRGISGREYIALSEALDRLAGTRIKTNIETNGITQTKNFGLIDESDIVRKNNSHDGRMLWCEIKLSEWVFNAIKGGEVLALNRDYFRLAKPIERRIYEIARKHCGDRQPKFSISLQVLLKKTGSQSPLKRFKQMVNDLVKYDHLPDYRVWMDEKDIVHFVWRKEIVLKVQAEAENTRHSFVSDAAPILKPETYDKARLVAPGYDIYALEKQWQSWWTEKGKPVLLNNDKAFLGFCAKKATQKTQRSLFGN